MRCSKTAFLSRILACIVCLLAPFSFFPATKGKTPPPVSPQLVSQIQQREREVWEAARQKDMHRFDALVADDARMIFTSGIMTKSEYLRSIGKRNITSYVLEDFQVLQPATDTVLTIYKVTLSGTFDGRSIPPSTVREASVWVKRSGKWLAVLNQETPVS
ncbi:MAG TPA: nuclear transport factor 2 family protein [Candidatus Dormibacteraeota bacterium]|nr:nuclear transport factor 2 family protein [Candidatus Dormibacteraeota bacterium]